MKLINDDCFKALKEIPSESIHSVITDPPYLIGFMGKKWDNVNDSIEFHKR